jgi:hypothetical protein
LTTPKKKGKAAKRIDFKGKVPSIIRDRADGKCSVPRCKNPTRGPAANSRGSVNLGMACHIYSASPDGPRGWGDKDEKFIGSVENGLWCCQVHGSAIDKNEGEGYPVEVLFAWKALAEARAKKLIDDTPSPLGWVDTIEVLSFPNAKRLPKLKLWRYTLVAGVHLSGQTSLLQAAAALTHSEYVQRFATTKFDAVLAEPSFAARVTYSTVDTADKWVDIETRGSLIVRIENDRKCLLPPGDVEIVYAEEKDLKSLDHEDHLDFLTRLLRVDRSALFAIAEAMDTRLSPGRLRFREGVLTDDDEPEITRARRKPNGERYIEAYINKSIGAKTYQVAFNGLSTSEKGRLIVALLIAKARRISEERLTLLIVEDPISNFDNSNLLRLLSVIKEQPFQAVVCIPPSRYADVIVKGVEGASLQPLDELAPWRLCWLPDQLYDFSRPVHRQT